MKESDFLKYHFKNTRNLNEYFSFFRKDKQFLYLESVRNFLKESESYMDKVFKEDYLTEYGIEYLIKDIICFDDENEDFILKTELTMGDLLLLIKYDLISDINDILEDINDFRYDIFNKLNFDEKLIVKEK